MENMAKDTGKVDNVALPTVAMNWNNRGWGRRNHNRRNKKVGGCAIATQEGKKPFKGNTEGMCGHVFACIHKMTGKNQFTRTPKALFENHAEAGQCGSHHEDIKKPNINKTLHNWAKGNGQVSHMNVGEGGWQPLGPQGTIDQEPADTVRHHLGLVHADNEGKSNKEC